MDTVKLSYLNVHFKSFLRAAGVPDVFVEYMIDCARSLDPAVVFSLLQSVFISYADADRQFAERLRDSLLKNGVRTWMFSDDADVGVSLHRVLQQAIGSTDRTLVICSKQSLNRLGVLHELKATLQRELTEGGTNLLIPVLLDDYAYSDVWDPKDSAIVAAIRNRVAADFRGATGEGPEFRSQLSRLIAALRSTPP